MNTITNLKSEPLIEEIKLAKGSILRQGRNCWKIARAEKAAFIIDAADYFSAFAQAAMHAQESIVIVGWDFDSRTRLWSGCSPYRCPETIGDFLNYLCARRRHLKIHILTWDFPLVYGIDREVPPLFSSGWRHHRRIQLEYDGKLPVGASHHQKLVIIDDAVAFCGGLDLTRKRWDTSDHLAENPDRSCDGTAYPPFHDLMMVVEGAAASELGTLARDRWRRATSARLRPAKRSYGAWPDALIPEVEAVDVAISRTDPAFDGREAIQEVEQLYIDAIAAAENVIYIENQYFTASRVGDALAAKLRGPEGPEIVLVLRFASDGWLEGVTMGALRDHLIKQLQEADHHGRLHVYYPLVPGLGEQCINVHAKLLIVDDQLLRIGSANLNNRSMILDTECDLSIEAKDDRTSKAITHFRDRLLAEHLGTTPAVVAKTRRKMHSVHATIDALRGDTRWLEPFKDGEKWPEGVASVVSYLDPEKPIPLDELMDEFAPQTSAAPRRSMFLKATIILLIVGCLIAAWRWTPLREWATIEHVSTIAEAFGDNPFAPVILIAAYTVAAVIFFPRPLLTIAGTLAFGVWPAFFYAMLGIVGAAVATYLLGRVMNRHSVRRMAGYKLNNLAAKLRTTNFLAIAAIRMLPVAPFALVNIVAGAVRIRLGHFALGTAIGMLPGTLAATVFGHQITTYMQNAGQLNYMIIAGVLAFWLAVFFGVRQWWSKQA